MTLADEKIVDAEQVYFDETYTPLLEQGETWVDRENAKRSGATPVGTARMAVVPRRSDEGEDVELLTQDVGVETNTASTSYPSQAKQVSLESKGYQAEKSTSNAEDSAVEVEEQPPPLSPARYTQTDDRHDSHDDYESVVR